MKPYLFIIALFTHTLTYSQGVGINTDGSMPATGAILDIKSTSGGLLIPRMTQAQRDLIEAGSPPQSLLIYQTDSDSGFYYHDGANWIPLLVGRSGTNSGWETKGNLGTTPTTHFIGTADSVDWVVRTDSTEQMRIKANGNVGIGNSNPSSSLHISGSMGAKVSLISSATHTAGEETHILANATMPITITLPAATEATDRMYFIKKTDATTNTVTIDGNGAETINGSATQTLSTQHDSYVIVCDGTQWHILSEVVSGNSTIPSGSVMFFDLSTCPTGWSELTSARGRSIVGMPSGGTLSATVGTALSDQENRPVGQHNHGITDPGHFHSLTREGAHATGFSAGPLDHYAEFPISGNTGSKTTGITINNEGTVAGTNAPYIQLLTCKKD